ncbi:DUF2786 domain-containing protein [Pseudomonas cichorii]|nr:DUF2786 domain-containing protein [Pseudomonas cichorii]
MDRKRIIEKVAKCFALAHSQGASPNEVETALRQARNLMKQHNLLEDELHASLASEHSVTTKTLRQPSGWMHSLAGVCAQAFDCDYLAYNSYNTGWSFKFVGVGISPELAAYAYSSLVLQLRHARSQHVSAQKRCKLATKRRRGQIFAEGWISAVSSKVNQFAGDLDPEAQQAITAYLAVHHPNVTTTEHKTTKAVGHDQRSLIAGWEQGANAALHRGVANTTRPVLAIGGRR